MPNGRQAQLDPVRFGLALSLLAILYGWGLGILFGAGEDWLRQGFIADAEAHRSLYLEKARNEPDPEQAVAAAIKKIDETSWRQFQRAHLHAGAIGSVALGASLLLSFLSVAPRWKLLASTLLGVGAVGYPLFWMLAGLRAPGLASSGAAKESLRWLAQPSSGSLIVGGVLTLGLVIFDLFLRRKSEGGGDRART